MGASGLWAELPHLTVGGPTFCSSSFSQATVVLVEERSAPRKRFRIKAACSATVEFSKKSDRDSAIGSFSRSNDKHWMASSEWPPSEKKLLCTSICGCVRIFARDVADHLLDRR